MTQKQALANICESIDWKPARYNLVFEWLEDINWHSEAGMLSEKISNIEMEELHLLDAFDYALRPSNYSHSYVESIKDKLTGFNDAVAEYHRGDYGGLIKLNDKVFSKSQIYDYQKKDFYRALSYIWGWGLTTSDWKATQGEDFVNELVAVIENPAEFTDK